MNKGYSSRGRTWASGIAAAAVTTILLSSLVESFHPAQLLQLEEKSAPEQVAALNVLRKLRINGHRPKAVRSYA